MAEANDQLQQALAQINALQAQVQQLQNNQGNAANIAAPPQLIMSPWEGELNLNDKLGRGMWAEGIKPLEKKFSGYAKDLPQFLANIKTRVDKCRWRNELTFDGKYLIERYGDISLQEVIDARNARNVEVPGNLQECRPKINATMMFHFVYESLGTIPQKKINTRLDSIQQDGPVLLKMVLDDTFVASHASMFAIKERFYHLNLKKYKWNVIAMNQDVREKQADLMATGQGANEADLIITLFRAYNTSTNKEFQTEIMFWKHEWNARTFTTAEALMQRADAKYTELREMGSWGKRDADTQVVALPVTTQTNQKKQQSNSSSNKNEKTNVPKWKYDRNLSSSGTYERNNKQYHWCEGPGHGGVGMWTIHESGTCTANKGGNGNAKNTTSSTIDEKALTASLKAKGLSEDEIDSKVQAIMAVLSS